MRVAILNDQGEVDNIIIADRAFCEANHPGRWHEVTLELEPVEIGQVWSGE